MISCPACNTNNDSAAATCLACGRLLPLPTGRLVAGRFEILEAIGRGGMGAVYRVRDHTLEEDVALKVLRADLGEGDELERRFRSEIKVARRVGHRNVCRVFEYGEEGPIRYIAMELVDGVNLRHLVSHAGGLPLSEAFEMSIQAVSGLEAIHELGFVHRDIKSANIMRDRRAVVKLMDFGIARPHAVEGGDVTATGVIVGTPEYMSPEQATGEKVDARSDIYSMGIVIYELFTGVVPFRGETPVATILKHIQEPFVPETAVGLPAPVGSVLVRCLAKRPRERFSSALELRRALELARDDSARAGAPAVVFAPAVDPTAAPTARTEPAVVPAPDFGSDHTHTVFPGRLPPAADLTLTPSATQALPGGGRSHARWVIGGAALGLVAGLAVVGYLRFRPRAIGPADVPSAAPAFSPTPASPPSLTPSPVPQSAGTPDATPEPTPTTAPVRDPARDSAAQLARIRRLEPEPAYGRSLELASRYPDDATLREETRVQRQRLVGHWVTKGQEALGRAAAGASEESYKQAVVLFERALELDPTNADAQSGRAVAARGPARPTNVPPDRVAFALSETTFQASPMSAAPAGMGKLPPGFEARPALPPTPQARVVIEIEPKTLRAGEAYVVRYSVFNQSQGLLRLLSASIKTQLGGGLSTGGPVQLKNKNAPPNERTLVVEASEKWRQDLSAEWSTTLMLVLEDASVYSATLHARR